MSKKPAASEPDKELIIGLDRAAKLLLSSAFPDNSPNTEPNSKPATEQALADQIKAFGAVSHWAIERTKVVAPKPAEKGKGELLHKRFHSLGRTSGRGNGAGEGEAPPADGGS